MQTTAFAPSALLLRAMRSGTSRPLASTPTLSSRSRTLTTQCLCTASTHCDSSRSRASNFTRPLHLLFCGDLLLVARLQRKTLAPSEIVSLNTTGGQLTRRRVLLDSNANVDVGKWCLAGNQLVICDCKSNGDLLVYAFE